MLIFCITIKTPRKEMFDFLICSPSCPSTVHPLPISDEWCTTHSPTNSLCIITVPHWFPLWMLLNPHCEHKKISSPTFRIIVKTSPTMTMADDYDLDAVVRSVGRSPCWLCTVKNHKLVHLWCTYFCELCKILHRHRGGGLLAGWLVGLKIHMKSEKIHNL